MTRLLKCGVSGGSQVTQAERRMTGQTDPGLRHLEALARVLLCNRSHGGVLSLKDCTVTHTLQSIIHLEDIRPDVELMLMKLAAVPEPFVT
ncbi:unnamed protein product [Arctogadus glacialis]